MRLSADWMTIADERILEFLRDVGPRQPAQIAEHEHIYFTPKYIGDRCRILTEYHLLANLGNGVYELTEQGEAYLAEELDAKTLDTR